ncbi:MAG: indolepyruvate oxidoreductase subunit beta [bacterium]|nr:indolepyruvate oxidoreductase subunit beta [bacterium]
MEADFILAGVGGQGIILAGDILAGVGLQAGSDVKKSEVHGMAQRGGVVTSHVRWGRRVRSPLAEPGRVGFLVGFEALEAARAASYLRPGGLAVVNRYRLPPPAVTAGEAVYPADDQVAAAIQSRGAALEWVPAQEEALRLGNPAVAGVYLLGWLSGAGVLGQAVAEETWVDVLEGLVPPAHRDLNRLAFRQARAARTA